MKFCHNNSKKKHYPGLRSAGIRHLEQAFRNSKLRQVLAWSLPLASLLTLAPTAQAQVATSVDWGTGAAGEAVDFPVGTNQNTYTNVGGSGVDVRVTVGGDVGNNGNANLDLTDSDFVSPSPPDETLLINLLGGNGDEATVTIEFLLTGTDTPVDVTLASFPIYDLDILFNNGSVSWQDEVVVSATSGGTPVTGITTSDGPALNEGTFNQEVIGPTSVTITGVAPGDDPNNPTQNANSPRFPGQVPGPNSNFVGDFVNGNVTVDFPNAADTITIQFSNGPGTEDFAPHAIAIGDINFTAPPLVAEEPAIGVSKRVVSAITQADGDFEVVYETTVENLGNVTLNNVQLTEDLDDTYGEGAFSIIGGPTFTPQGVANEVALTPNPGFDADAPNGTPGDTNILAAAQTLQVGEESTFRFTVEIDNDQITTPGTFTNQIEAVGTSPNNTTVDDDSDDGVETDADPNDGNPGGGPTENDPTPVQLPPTEEPFIGVSKRVISATTQADGDFEVVYETTVENLGNVPLNNVQLTEDLDDTYGEGAFSIIGGPTFTPQGIANEVALVPNGNFDADAPVGAPGDVNILVGNQTLDVGENSTFQFTVEVESDLVTVPDTFLNQIEAVGTSPSGTTVDDDSDNGVDTDPDPGDGTPGGGPNENDPTPVLLPPTPVIGVAKQVSSSVIEPAGTFGNATARVTYDIVVANVGTVPLEEVQVDEDLDSVYGAGAFEVVDVTLTAGATTLAADPGFDGIVGGNTTLLADTAGTPTGTLAVGASTTFQLVVDVNTSSPNLTPPLPGPYVNQVAASATDADGNTTNDLSDSGPVVDPDGDGDPNEPGENDPTQISFEPDLRLLKRITQLTRNGVELALEGDSADPNGDGQRLQTLSNNTLPLGLTNVSNTLQSGDLVEYTVFFFNIGTGTAENVEVCDELQPPSILQPGSLELSQPTVGGNLNFSPNGPLFEKDPLEPLEPSCLSAPGEFPSSNALPGPAGVGAGGGVVVGGPESGLNVETSAIGAFRFEIRIP
ncbi:conserved repeat protein [Leptolyngbya sp. Heron Island J]|uniref:hypothetical protein n=1 Tax=Leptolyngbya sp. Heron Island J TaxID=1385935 RepID=UPI0003B94B5B|nr:hypothetical protein [Leptolyngbya sp. Heron Island J]ESA37060.1 conserved repeat protein [Leptolyngbya sp. Heron Island J]